METIYNIPSKFMVSSFGTIKKQMMEAEGDTVKFLLWVQVSKDPNRMEWITAEKLLGIALEPRIVTDDNFRNEVIDLYIKNTQSVE
jgi:hypothetical protein